MTKDTEMLVPRADFSLDDRFIAEYRGRQPRWGELGYLVYKRTYALELEDGTTEEFWQTCRRVVEGTYQVQKGHCRRHGLPWNDEKAQASAQEMYARMFAFKWLPPGRGLSKMGTEIMFKIGSACLQNCGVYTTKDIGSKDIKDAFSKPFTWLMNMSMLGVGVSLDTRGAGKIRVLRTDNTMRHIVGDSREGWCDYLRALLQSFVDPAIPFPVADYSLVRPKGSPIRGFGGTASGPEALKRMTGRLVRLRDMYVGKDVDSRFIVDIANSIGECVVAGGVRRTAELMLGDPNDDTFLNLKNYQGNPEATEWPRWASNNSVEVTPESDFEKLAALTVQNGEPGYLFVENARNYSRMGDPADYRDRNIVAFNPCSEIGLNSAELCNLNECFPHNCDDLEDFKRTLKFAYLYSKTVTLIPTHSDETNAEMLRNRRIGCSVSGIQDAIEKVGTSRFIHWCDEGYRYIQELDTVYSNWLCIPKSIKTTAIKPSGTVSKLVGVREGLHESKGEYEFQTIRINDDSPLVPRLEAANYRIEPAIKEANTVVVYFPMYYPRTRKRNPTMWEQLELAATMQAVWADNAVSVTVDFDRDTEGPEIARALEMYSRRLKGVSFLPRDDHGYAQPPKAVVTKEEYETYKAQLKPLDLTGIRTREVEEKYCDGGLCTIGPREVDSDAAE